MHVSLFLIHYHCDPSCCAFSTATDGLGQDRNPGWQGATFKREGGQFKGPNCSLMLSRSHGLHGAWQRAGRGSHGEESGPAKSCKGRSDPQTSRVEEETPTATSFPQGAHAILEQGESNDAHCDKMGPKTETVYCSLPTRPTLCPTFCQLRAIRFSREYKQKHYPVLIHNCWQVGGKKTVSMKRKNVVEF